MSERLRFTYFADGDGIWRKRNEQLKRIMAWIDVYRVSVAVLDGITELRRSVEIDVSWGEYVEVYDNTEGFDEFVTQLGKHLNCPFAACAVKVHPSSRTATHDPTAKRQFFICPSASVELANGSSSLFVYLFV